MVRNQTAPEKDNLKGLSRSDSAWVERAMVDTPDQQVILDLARSERKMHGHQEGFAYNGSFDCVRDHPLSLFNQINQFGDCEAGIPDYS